MRISYTIFMWGIVLASIAFGIAAIGGFGGSGSSSIPIIDY